MYACVSRRTAHDVGERNAPDDRDDVRKVERHGRHREDSVDRDRARKVEETREDADEDDKPDSADRSLRPRVDMPEEAAVREPLVATEGIDGTRRGLERRLTNEEGRQADECLDECGR